MQTVQNFTFPVTRRQLAMHYFTSPTSASAVKKMGRWLKDDPHLRDDLQAVGYHSGQKLFNKVQADVLYKYFG